MSDDGWLVFGNVFSATGDFIYNYGGVFPAPNGGPGFSGIDIGQGGPEQGAQQLVVYNDYNNFDHTACGPAGPGPYDPSSPTCRFIEANVFQEQVIGAADVGNTWLFEFDAKRGNIEGVSTARAFIKTLDPGAGFALSNFIWIDMTNVPDTWDRYSLPIDIDPGLVGHILQIGYLTYTTAYNGSGIFYDNINFFPQPLSVSLDVKPGSCPNPINSRAPVLRAALLGTMDLDVNDVDVTTLQLEGVSPIKTGYEDVATPFGGDLCGCTEDGPDGYFDLTLKFLTSEIVGGIGSSSGDVTLTLTGNLLDGTPIEGQDCVFFVGGGVGGGGRPGVSGEAWGSTNPLAVPEVSTGDPEPEAPQSSIRR
ncbi:MAG: hypothetical protein OEQ13_02110 [Acidobacteriota bacterium]|nr:hypothetical protein [Acidobacteriota bacterium]